MDDPTLVYVLMGGALMLIDEDFRWVIWTAGYYILKLHRRLLNAIFFGTRWTLGKRKSLLVFQQCFQCIISS